MTEVHNMQGIFEKLMKRKVNPDNRDILMALENLHSRLLEVESLVGEHENKIYGDSYD